MAVPQPHDAFFKQVFCRPELAADLIRRRLPAPVAAELDLDRLEPLPGEFIDQELRSRRADLVFQAPLRAGPAKPGRDPAALFQFLVEHRTTPQRLLPLRMARYGLHLLTGYAERYAATHGRPPAALPLIVPIIVYQGRRPWSGPRDLCELFPVPPGMAPILGPYLPRFRLIIDDLSADEPPETPARLALTEAVLLTMRYVRNEADPEGFKRRLQALLEAAKDEPHKVPVVAASARYLYDTSDRLGTRDIVQMADAVADTETKETLMTIAEQFKAIGHEEGLRKGMQQGLQQGMQQGRQQGMQQGLQQGMQRGQHDGRAAALLNLIQLKFGPPDEPTAERIRRADIEDLDRWIARILTADSIDALLAEAP